MSVSGQSGCGEIRMFEDFCGAEIPIANAVAYGTSAGGCNYYIGDFKVTGSLQDTDSGIVGLSKASGYGQLSASATADGDGCFFGTEVSFSPILNGTIVVEARLERAALTAGTTFVGLMGVNIDEVDEPITCATTTLTKVTHCVGFLLNSELTAADGVWHMPYLLAADTTQSSSAVEASQTAVLAESDIVRLEVDNDGSARWFINGKLEQSVGAGLAATPATLMAAGVGIFSTTTTAATVDVDYLLVKANRDWTR